jgi:hypothetical protein
VPSKNPVVNLRDSCAGRADGVYCSQLAPYGAFACKNQDALQCPAFAQCIGPNGPGIGVQCEGEAPPPDGGAPDSCAGRPDGLYCSVVAPYAAYKCVGGSIAGGQQCPSGKLCKGPNGSGSMIACQ